MNEKYLPHVVEEAGEVLQAIGKIQRFGLNTIYKWGPSNYHKLILEIGDLLEVIRRLDLDPELLLAARRRKIARLDKWGPDGSEIPQ